MKFLILTLAISSPAWAQTNIPQERKQLRQDRHQEAKDLKAHDASAVHDDNVERRSDRRQLHQDLHQRRKGRR